MLHRLALRVLPQLSGLVTDAPVRRRKRWVMLVPGLVAFGMYRMLTAVAPLSDPLVLLACSGMISMVAAFWAYGMGREEAWTAIVHAEKISHLAWIGGWIGFAYGVQLSLLVLALLKIMVNYDFFLHPDGPAMMAIIIACTSVTRDAFEIGHVRKMERHGQTILTFPRGALFRQWIRLEPVMFGRWIGTVALIGGAGAVFAGWLLDSASSGRLEWLHVLMMGLLVSCLGLVAFFAGESRSGNWIHGMHAVGWRGWLRFWVWPCLTFAVTYYLVLVGILYFVLRIEHLTLAMRAWVGGMTTAILVGYGLYLGRRKLFEFQAGQGLSENLQRCPFVMSMLEKARATTGSGGGVGSAPAISSRREHIS